MLRRLLGRSTDMPASPGTPASPHGPLNSRKDANPSKLDPAFSERADHAARSAFLREHLFVQTHIPKTGGTAFYQNLSAIFGGMHSMDVRLSLSVPFRELSAADIAEIHFVSGHFDYGKVDVPGRKLLHIAAVREPVSRAVSMYRYLQTAQSQAEHAVATSHGFDEAWHILDRDFPSQRRDRQSGMVMGQTDVSNIQWDAVRARVEDDYFLVVPQDKIAPTIRKIRVAMGLPRAEVLRANVSKSEPFEPSKEIARTIRAANPLDAELYAHVRDRFETRLAEACQFLAERCLQRRAETGQG